MESLYILYMKRDREVTTSMLTYIPEKHSHKNRYQVLHYKQKRKNERKKAKKYLASFRPNKLFSSIGITINTKRKPKTLTKRTKVTKSLINTSPINAPLSWW